jgi:hypothetical protein
LNVQFGHPLSFQEENISPILEKNKTKSKISSLLQMALRKKEGPHQSNKEMPKSKTSQGFFKKTKETNNKL